MKLFWQILGVVTLFLLAVLVFSLVWGSCNTAIKMVDNGQKVIYDQFKPEELLRKYEWFKDASAQLDAKVATLHMYENREKSLKDSYGNDRSKWSRTDQEQSNLWQSEYLGVKASYNDLCSQYNAAMAKFNYRFCNAGGLPQGTTEPLPREYKPYIIN